jgi:NADH-quinone oxidoreductase subunit E
MFKESKFTQPTSFEFTKDNLEKAKQIIANYPKGKQQSAVMPLLDLAQRQHNNWLPRAAMDYVAELLDMPFIKVYEVATFYTMYNKQPVGKNLIQICRTTPCWLMGSDEITKACKQKLGTDIGETTSDGKFTIVEVECIGACVNAPAVQINDDYYEDLTPESMKEILNMLAENKKPKIGSQTGRQTSAAAEFVLEPTTIRPEKKKVRKKNTRKGN